MLFHSVQFLALLAVTFALYWAVRLYKWPRLIVLFGASLVFYSAWHMAPLLVFLWYGLVNVAAARIITRSESQAARKWVTALAVVNHLAVLSTFKYLDLFLNTGAWFAQKLGLELRVEPLGLLLPVGLSFICFKAISYIVDVYRGHIHGRNNLFEQMLYLLFFPQVVAGPITRARDLLSRVNETPRLKPEDGAQAIFRIATGISKKLLIGDVLAVGLIEPVFSNPHHYTSAECAVATVAYTLQIYFDFSAYSDIALGASALFGLPLPENFNKPFHARNLFEFWNRWHVSLSTWLRDYLYIPLGGNRGKRWKVLRNLMAVMVLGGLWHGADWRFALWGLIHGVLLVATRCLWWWRGKPSYDRWWKVAFGTATTFVLVALTRIFFRAPDVGSALEIFGRFAEASPGLANVSKLCWAALAGAIVFYLLPDRWYERTGQLFFRLPVPARAAVLVALGLIIAQVASFEAQPYIYFQF